MFEGRHVVLGVSGGIAAYKSIEVCRRLVDGGARVTPVLTESALKFVGPVTFEALATEPLVTSVFGNADPIPHTTLGQTADLIIVAPATARAIASYAAGISDDALVATLIATRAPVLICPAMHTEMWEHPSVQENLATLRRRGVNVLDPESGRLAGGDVGEGRLADPAHIIAEASRLLTTPDMSGVSVLVTAGGTREPIDPVRFIGNHSSGKQGYAVAAEAASRGASVTLVSTVDLATPHGVEVIAVETAQQMHDVVMARSDTDVVVMSAAVADYRPSSVSDSKIKKNQGDLEVQFERTVDILAALGRVKTDHQTVVGFAAETENVIDNARSKLELKGADLVVANDVSAPQVGFAHDTNEVTIVSAAGSVEVPLRSKREIAKAVLDAVVALRDA
ncbi:MAG: bifunctional phosphopantothenoylcysteine decarboxylase/phosphopantothenate--cysteine ligase CoaBC [Actinomycetia bacterium]|nr:bifunctional phosphopantothenoylcysteine decarboxylase/phosphopantothenate--cysteine ligase CoaBC [Actinomycetes bacterium]